MKSADTSNEICVSQPSVEKKGGARATLAPTQAWASLTAARADTEEGMDRDKENEEEEVVNFVVKQRRSRTEVDIMSGLVAGGRDAMKKGGSNNEVRPSCYARFLEEWRRTNIYRPLETASSIRVIQILPDLVCSNIAIKIHHIDTKNTNVPAYHALSYCWGDSNPRHSIIIINEYDKQVRYPLHDSLWQFLHRMWVDKATDRLYWTDMLCINQHDNAERAHQVARMGQIYEGAKEVLIWLGHDLEGEKAMGWIHGYPKNAIEKREVRRAGKQIVDLEYWSRVWIFQEVALPRKATLMCGRSSSNFDDVMPKILEITNMTHRGHYSMGYRHCLQLHRMRLERTKKPLWRLIRSLGKCHSTKAIDKIYGLLGLAEDRDSKRSIAMALEVDYEKGPLEIFWDTLFECGAPWKRYAGLVEKLALMLAKDGQPWWYLELEKYIQAPRTSRRHARYAKIVLRVLNAGEFIINTSKEDDAQLKFFDVVKACSKAASLRGAVVTNDQNAAVLGLAILYHWHVKNIHRGAFAGSIDSRWHCAHHRAADVDVKGGVPYTTPAKKSKHPVIRLEDRRFKGLCHGASSHQTPCEEHSLYFDMPDVGFGLLLSADAGSKGALLHLFLAQQPRKITGQKDVTLPPS